MMDSIVVSSSSIKHHTHPAATPPRSFLEEAREKTKGELYLNQTCIVELEGNIKKALLVCAPLGGDGDEALRECYQTIFRQALLNDVQTLLVPTFSTGDGGYDHKEAALIAINEATLFYQDNPDANIDISFVVYQNQDGTICDRQNMEAYGEALIQINQRVPGGLPQRLSCSLNQIQFLHGGMVVIPVGEHFETTGPVCMAIENASQHDIEERRNNVLLGDPFAYILPHLDTEGVRSLMSVSKRFSRGSESAVEKKLGLTELSCQYFYKSQLGPFDDKGKSILLSPGGYPYLVVNEAGQLLVACHDSDKDSGYGECWSFFPAEEWLSDPVRGVPIHQKWIPAAPNTANFPTFLALGGEQTHDQQLCESDATNALAKHPFILKHYCENETYAKQINLALTYDAFGDDAVVKTTEIEALKAALALQKPRHAGTVYVYEKLSPMTILTMRALKVFSIPAFFSAYTTQLDLKAADCPVQLYDRNKFPKGCNVIFKIHLGESAQAATLSDKQVLFSCYSKFRYLGHAEDVENEILVVSLEATSDDEGTLPPPKGQYTIFEWLRRQGTKQLLTSEWYAEGIVDKVKAISASFDRNSSHNPGNGS